MNDRPNASRNGRESAGASVCQSCADVAVEISGTQLVQLCGKIRGNERELAGRFGDGRGSGSFGKRRTYGESLAVALLYCADDGLDRPSLPLFPSPARTARAPVHRDGHDRCGAARRPRAFARLQRAGASACAAARRPRAGGIGGFGAHRRGVRLRRDQPQRRLPVGSAHA